MKHDSLDKWYEKIQKIRTNDHKLRMLVIEKILVNPPITGKEIQKSFLCHLL